MKNLTIFEGCDCTGKTTIARQYAEGTGARYFSLGPLKGQTDIAHVYLNAMEVAIAGRSDVVMDRSWISEPIYGEVFRGGADRIGKVGATALAYVAQAFTNVAYVKCDPGWSHVANTFQLRTEIEMLDDLHQLKCVYIGYRDAIFPQPRIVYDYTESNLYDLSQQLLKVRGSK